MHRLKLLIKAVLAVLLVAVVVVFVLQNTTPVTVELFAYQGPETSLAIYLLSAFILGTMLGLIVTWLTAKFLRNTKK